VASLGTGPRVARLRDALTRGTFFVIYFPSIFALTNRFSWETEREVCLPCSIILVTSAAAGPVRHTTQAGAGQYPTAT
jgi:hypothetical protein